MSQKEISKKEIEEIMVKVISSQGQNSTDTASISRHVVIVSSQGQVMSQLKPQSQDGVSSQTNDFQARGGAASQRQVLTEAQQENNPTQGVLSQGSVPTQGRSDAESVVPTLSQSSQNSVSTKNHEPPNSNSSQREIPNGSASSQSSRQILSQKQSQSDEKENINQLEAIPEAAQKSQDANAPKLMNN